MPNGILRDIGQIIAELIPGEQPWLGELPGGETGIVGGAMAALAQLLPGQQPWQQREPPRPYVKSWTTGTVGMYLFPDGKIGCYKKNGIWKEWRPARHIVVPRNPRIGTLLRAHRRTTRLVTGLARQAGYTKRRPLGRIQQRYLSPVERKLLTGGS